MEELGPPYLTETPRTLADGNTVKEQEEPAATAPHPLRPSSGGLQGWDRPSRTPQGDLHLHLPKVPHLWDNQPHKGPMLGFPPHSRPSPVETQACQRRSPPSILPPPPWQNTSIKQTLQGLPNLDSGTTPRSDMQTHQPASVHHQQAQQKPNTKHPYKAGLTSTQAPSVRRKKMGFKGRCGCEEEHRVRFRGTKAEG